MVEEQRRMDEERLKMQKERDKKVREEQKLILGKGNARPKVSFGLKPAKTWGPSPSLLQELRFLAGRFVFDTVACDFCMWFQVFSKLNFLALMLS